MTQNDTNRPGIALLLAILTLAVLSALSIGLLFVTTQEIKIARAIEETVHVRIAAESAVRSTIADWPKSTGRLPRDDQTRAPGTTPAAPPEIQTSVSFEHLENGNTLIVATAESQTGAFAQTGLLASALHVPDLWTTFPAALTATNRIDVGSTTSTITLEGARDPVAELSESPACGTPAVDDLIQTFGSGPRPAQSQPPAYAPSSPETDPWLGPLRIEELASAADRTETKTVTPGPSHDGATCDTYASGNWGDPGAADDDGLCATYFPLIIAPGDLRVAGGIGQGILVVAGDLTLEGGASFYGPVLLSGDLQFEEDAAIYGAVTKIGSQTTRLTGRGKIVYDACSIWRALARSTLLEMPQTTGSRTWIPIR